MRKVNAYRNRYPYERVSDCYECLLLFSAFNVSWRINQDSVQDHMTSQSDHVTLQYDTFANCIEVSEKARPIFSFTFTVKWIIDQTIVILINSS